MSRTNRTIYMSASSSKRMLIPLAKIRYSGREATYIEKTEFVMLVEHSNGNIYYSDRLSVIYFILKEKFQPSLPNR